MSIVHVTSENYTDEVLNCPDTVLLDFFAQWCGPCRMIAPILEQIAAERPEIKICKIDVDTAPDLAMAYHVASIPMLIVRKNGAVTAKTVGACPKEEILQLLEK